MNNVKIYNRIKSFLQLLKQQFMTVFYIYIAIWFMFGCIYCFLSNITSGEVFLFQENILVKSKNVSFQKDVNVEMNYDITKKLFTGFDKSTIIMKMREQDTPFIRYNIISENGLTPIGIDWSNYYITKFYLEGYNFCSARILERQLIYGPEEYTKLEFSIHRINETDLFKISENQLLSLSSDYKDKIVDTKNYYVWIKSDMYGLETDDWNLFGERVYFELGISKQFLSLAVNYLDSDIDIIYDYEMNNTFSYSLLDFLYFSAVTISTLGFGDILPNSTAIRVLVMIEALIGMILLAIFVSYFFEWLKKKEGASAKSIT